MSERRLPNLARTQQRHCRSVANAILDKRFNTAGDHPCNYAMSWHNCINANRVEVGTSEMKLGFGKEN